MWQLLKYLTQCLPFSTLNTPGSQIFTFLPTCFIMTSIYWCSSWKVDSPKGVLRGEFLLALILPCHFVGFILSLWATKITLKSFFTWIKIKLVLPKLLCKLSNTVHSYKILSLSDYCRYAGNYSNPGAAAPLFLYLSFLFFKKMF